MPLASRDGELEIVLQIKFGEIKVDRTVVSEWKDLFDENSIEYRFLIMQVDISRRTVLVEACVVEICFVEIDLGFAELVRPAEHPESFEGEENQGLR